MKVDRSTANAMMDPQTDSFALPSSIRRSSFGCLAERGGRRLSQ